MYPNNLLSRPVRIAIMTCLIVSFFIISPLVILYTIGYRYDIRTGIVRETGVLSIDVDPKEARVFLDSVEINKRLPIRLTNLIPGTYALSIEAGDHHPWTKEILIESKQTTYIRNIRLFEENVPEVAFDMNESIVDVQGAYDGSFLLLTTKQEQVYDVTLVNTRTGTRTTIVRAAADRMPVIEWSDFQHDAFIEVTSQDISRLYLFSARNPEIIRSYTYRTQTGTHPHQWPRSSSEPTLFVQEDDTVYRINMQSEGAVGSVGTPVWHVDEQDNLWVVQENGRSLSEANRPEQTLYQSSKTIDRIITVNDTFIIIGVPTGIDVLRRDSGRIEQTASLPTQHARYNYSTEEWMSWSPWEIWSIYEDGGTALLNRISEQVLDVRPLDQYGVLLLVREGSLTAFNPGYFIRQTLLMDTPLTPVAIDTDARTIFLFEPEGAHIERLSY